MATPQLDIDDPTLRVETFAPAAPATDEPNTWPRVRIVHLPTGLTTTATSRMRTDANAAALDGLNEALAARS